MTDQDDPRLRFTEAMVEWLRVRAREDMTILPFLAHLIRGMRDGFDDLAPNAPQSDTGFDEPEAAGIAFAGLEPTPLNSTVEEIRNRLFWHPFIAPSPRSPDGGTRIAFMHGDGGLLGCGGVKTGFLLVPDGVQTPLFATSSPTLYAHLSGIATLHTHLDAIPFPLSPETYAVTPRVRVHALSATQGPALIFFARTGNLTDPLQVWQQKGDDWQTIPHSEDADGVWWPGSPEPADPDRIEEETRDAD